MLSRERAVGVFSTAFVFWRWSKKVDLRVRAEPSCVCVCGCVSVREREREMFRSRNSHVCGLLDVKRFRVSALDSTLGQMRVRQNVRRAVLAKCARAMLVKCAGAVLVKCACAHVVDWSNARVRRQRRTRSKKPCPFDHL